jgi:lysophospholipid hydrolase
MLTGEANFYSCKAQEFSRIAILTRDTFFEIVCETPEMVLALAHNVVGRLSPLVRQVDFALDWINMESGKSLFRQGDATDGTFIVLSGRLRSSISGAGAGSKKELVDEYIHGNMVGLVDVVTGTNRLTTVMAVRDSELCKIPANLLNLLKQRYPVVVSKLISLLGHRLLGTFAGGGHGGLGRTNPKSKISDNNSFQSSYTTVALYAASPDVPLTAFAMELAHALSVCGQIKRISSDLIYDKFGANAFESGRDFRLNAWLAMVEHRHKVVLYQCDPEMTKWTSRCLRHADVIFDIVRADRETQEVTRAERQLEMEAKRVRKELILLHDEDTERPRGTREWLKRRTWISSHFHVKTAKKLFSRRSQSKIIDYYDRVMLEQVPNIHSDYSRLGRHITGASVGLVMGGGGARGAAHIGMLKAIQEAGIPVDRLGGVSIGAFMGGLWGSSRDMTMVTQKARNYFEGLANHLMAPVFDFTYPITSLMSGRYFNGTLMEVFGTELEIEDLWLPFFCCSTDITLSQERVHTKGSFWRYCRASMSYAWFLPPLCDPVDGHLLMDGCYVNNVPGDVMAGQGCKYILAIDVTAIDDRVLYNYGDYLSGWWVLWNKINPFATPLKIPPQSEIQLRLAFCSHYKNLEELKSNPNYEYIHPPIAKYSSGQVSRLITQVGRRYIM